MNGKKTGKRKFDFHFSSSAASSMALTIASLEVLKSHAISSLYLYLTNEKRIFLNTCFLRVVFPKNQ